MDWSGYLASQGRGGDTMLAHITPKEAALLKALGGSGTINPRTGLREFWDTDGEDGRDGSSSPGGGAPGGGGMGGGYSSMSSVEQEQADKEFGASLGIGKDAFTSIAELAHSQNTMIGNVVDQISGFWDSLTPADIANAAVKALGIAMSANPFTAAVMAGTMATINFGVKDAIALSKMTDEERATALANNKTEMPAAPIDATDTSGRKLGGYFNEKIVEENEESLNRVLAQAGEVGNMKLAIEATQKFSETTAKKVEFEAQMRRYADDPEFDAIEPELRVLADAAIKKGMPPAEAVKQAYEAVKKLRGYRIRLADMVNKAKVTESENIGVKNMEVPL